MDAIMMDAINSNITEWNLWTNHSEWDTGDSTYVCDQQTTDLYLLLRLCFLALSVIVLVIFSFTEKRRNLCSGCLHGRPGIVFPMNCLESRHDRWAYAAAYAVLAISVLDFFLFEDQTTVGPPYMKQLSLVLLVLRYGLVVYPLFTAITLNTIFSYSIGWVYLIIYMGIEVLYRVECTGDQVWVMYLGMCLPAYLGMVILFVDFPVQIIRHIVYRIKYRSFKERINHFLQENYQAKYVRVILKKKVTIDTQGLSRGARVKSGCISLFKRYTYTRMPGYKYSTRMVTTFTVAIILVYAFALMFYFLFLSIVDDYGAYLEYLYSDFGVLIQVTRGCVIGALTIAFLASLLTIAYMMANFRENLMAIQRGDYSNIPPPSKKGNIGWMMGYVKFAGFQVAYITWAFVIHALVLTAVFVLIGIVIALLVMENAAVDILIMILQYAWPYAVTTIVLLIIQRLLTWLVFLQERGKVLAVNNRNLMFNFLFFMFIYNMLLGLFSTLMRILKGMAVGLLFLGRLDHSTLPRHADLMLDPGYGAYVGMLHVENAHTHPVMVTFVHILVIEFNKKNAANDDLDDDLTVVHHTEPVASKTENGIKMELKTPEEGVTRARTRWLLAYTLLNNPKLIYERKRALGQTRKSFAFLGDAGGEDLSQATKL
ncbi:stimulated by retinoic acid gene 6 protein-like [Lingula anatina]|uniref:Receptor for retinol uptake STRA6 n=1 Tax=Lingula anatina TaxID=7574 RepID=A0A1S3K4F1_LINAN|nr:stimulated by retinoic acid gene 6 protein-like [Lingula anatina]XP_013417294.1 stimulated by retinoic acid gene 6 protein-like [Lingula anatina]XP_013417295.1 stimulated by retinoic acid gene 6 protein-like [Lingula anatina]XP_013417296.1 stimulated by retinoic acid gene 6 protein-like [Lingula anatina]XP_023933125.1 stimulated by retinoic acid gene 6 protein-like [Lingula anatina]|eukprot:XP_013417293.1 stimulated by retinoic acid gene 6 protein-like [Lingula anatina]